MDASQILLDFGSRNITDLFQGSVNVEVKKQKEYSEDESA